MIRPAISSSRLAIPVKSWSRSRVRTWKRCPVSIHVSRSGGVDGGLRVEEHPLDLAAALTGIMRLVHDVAVDLVPVAG